MLIPLVIILLFVPAIDMLDMPEIFDKLPNTNVSVALELDGTLLDPLDV